MQTQNKTKLQTISQIKYNGEQYFLVLVRMTGKYYSGVVESWVLCMSVCVWSGKMAAMTSLITCHWHPEAANCHWHSVLRRPLASSVVRPSTGHVTWEACERHIQPVNLSPRSTWRRRCQWFIRKGREPNRVRQKDAPINGVYLCTPSQEPSQAKSRHVTSRLLLLLLLVVLLLSTLTWREHSKRRPHLSSNTLAISSFNFTILQWRTN